MPELRRNGVTLSVAYQEAAAIAPVTRAMLMAYELWHPSFDEPVWFVNDVAPLEAALEADAPRFAGEVVIFMACPLSLQRPEESDTAANPSVTMGRPDVAGLLKRALARARGSIEPWTIIERVYASDDPSGPAQLPPLTYQVNQVQITATLASLSASYVDHANEGVPRTTFRSDEYPGLSR